MTNETSTMLRSPLRKKVVSAQWMATLAMSFAMLNSGYSYAVQHVVPVGNYTQMIGVNAIADTTDMVNIGLPELRNWPLSSSQRQAYPVSNLCRTLKPEISVSSSIHSTSPEPAGIRLANFGPKALFDSFRHVFNLSQV